MPFTDEPHSFPVPLLYNTKPLHPEHTHKPGQALQNIHCAEHRTRFIPSDLIYMTNII